jgi:hypothetical protein
MILPAKPLPQARSQYYYWMQIMAATTSSHNWYHFRSLRLWWYDFHLHLNCSKLATYMQIKWTMTYMPIDKLTIWILHHDSINLMTISTWLWRKARMHLKCLPDLIHQLLDSINQAIKISNEGNAMEAIWVLCGFTKSLWPFLDLALQSLQLSTYMTPKHTLREIQIDCNVPTK